MVKYLQFLAHIVGLQLSEIYLEIAQTELNTNTKLTRILFIYINENVYD